MPLLPELRREKVGFAPILQGVPSVVVAAGVLELVVGRFNGSAEVESMPAGLDVVTDPAPPVAGALEDVDNRDVRVVELGKPVSSVGSLGVGVVVGTGGNSTSTGIETVVVEVPATGLLPTGAELLVVAMTVIVAVLEGPGTPTSPAEVVVDAEVPLSCSGAPLGEDALVITAAPDVVAGGGTAPAGLVDVGDPGEPASSPGDPEALVVATTLDVVTSGDTTVAAVVVEPVKDEETVSICV
jgi:hypothetical protein